MSERLIFKSRCLINVTSLWLVLFASIVAHSQLTSPILENFTSKSLPSDEVHSMFQDSLGYMWFATDNGISKFDGQHFQKIKTDTYLLTPVVFNFFKVSETEVWINTSKNRLYHFNPLDDEPIFEAFQYNDALEKSLNSKFSTKLFGRFILAKEVL